MNDETRLIIINKKKKVLKRKKLQARLHSDIILKQYFEIEKEESKEVIETEKW